jgi:hypothetical protein
MLHPGTGCLSDPAVQHDVPRRAGEVPCGHLDRGRSRSALLFDAGFKSIKLANPHYSENFNSNKIQIPANPQFARSIFDPAPVDGSNRLPSFTHSI